MTDSPTAGGQSPHPPERLGWRRGAALAAACWLTLAGVHHAIPGWNVNSRFALTRAIVERGSFIVDGYVDRDDADHYTEDRSLYGGHYYSDKIIGTSLLGAPAYAAVRVAGWLAGREVPLPLARWIVTNCSVGLCAALAAAVMASLLLAYGATAAEALLLTLAMNFGTMLWGYGTLFYSYLPAICFFLIAWNVLLRARLSGGVGAGDMVRAGLALGAALLCEYTVGIVAAALGLYALIFARRRWTILWLGAAAALMLVPFAAYTLACFGEVCIPYKYLENRQFLEGMGRGVQGIEVFRLATLYYITVHPFRGVLWLSPFLLLSLVGMIRMALTRGPFRIDGLMCAGVFLGYVAFNSSYYMWWGGWAMGPRHLIPGLPFAIPPLLWILRAGRAWAAAFGVALAASIWLSGVPALVDPQIPQGYATEELFGVSEGFLTHDFRDPRALAVRFRVDDDPLTAWLRRRFSPTLRQAMERAADPALPEDFLRWALASELNQLIERDTIWDPERFAGVELDRATRRLIESAPEGADRARLNRKLLEQAYPGEIIARGHFYSYRSPVLAVCWPAFFRGGAAWNRAVPYGLRGPWYFLILAAAWGVGWRIYRRAGAHAPDGRTTGEAT